MEVYIGVDFHPHSQTVAWCDRETGETETVTLRHDPGKVAEFYSSFPKPAVIGIEALSRALWFEKLMDETGHRLLVGNPEKIRKRALSRHKNDRRDAELILTLLLRDEFLNGELFYTLKEAQVLIEKWRAQYNTIRPHSSLGYRPPAPEAVMPKEEIPDLQKVRYTNFQTGPVM